MGSKKKSTTNSTQTTNQLQNTNQTQTTAPAAWVAPGLQSAGQQVSSAVAAAPAIPSLTPQVMAAYGQTASDASNFAGMLRGQVGDGSALPSLNGSFANYDASAINPVIAAAIAPVQRNLDQTLASQQSSAAAAGAYGTSRALTQLPAMAIDAANRNQQELATQLAYQDYTAQQQKALAIPAYLSSIAGLDANAADVLGAANSYQYNAPYLGLDTAAGLLSSLGQGYGTTSSAGTQNSSGTTTGTSTTVEKTGGLGSVVSGIAGLAGMAAGIPGIGSGISSLFNKGFQGLTPTQLSGSFLPSMSIPVGG